MSADAVSTPTPIAPAAAITHRVIMIALFLPWPDEDYSADRCT
jgi:hypothetical protein